MKFDKLYEKLLENKYKTYLFKFKTDEEAESISYSLWEEYSNWSDDDWDIEDNIISVYTDKALKSIEKCIKKEGIKAKKEIQSSYNPSLRIPNGAL